MKLTDLLNEEKYTIIDPKGNPAGTGTKDQANQRQKKLGGSKKGYFVVPAKKALKARRTLEKYKFDFKSTKLQDLMSDLYFEGVDESVNEAVTVSGKADANRVKKAYEGFFKAYPALNTSLNRVGVVKILYLDAMIDANFGREGNATVNQMKGRVFPIEVKVADLNNTTIKIPIAKLNTLIKNHANAISGAAKWSGLAIVEGTAVYLDSIGQTKFAENLLDKFNKMN